MDARGGGNILYHVSDRPDIASFLPRADCAHEGAPCVWAIDAEHLPNYLLPRDCPRVTWSIAESTSTEDRRRFAPRPPATRVIAIEQGWVERAHGMPVTLYTLPAKGFQRIDANAGYYVSREAVPVLEAHTLDDPLRALASRPVELRVLDTLWPLHDAIAASTVSFSIIRMRHATPR